MSIFAGQDKAWTTVKKYNFAEAGFKPSDAGFVSVGAPTPPWTRLLVDSSPTVVELWNRLPGTTLEFPGELAGRWRNAPLAEAVGSDA